jgi:ribosomal protein S27AE
MDRDERFCKTCGSSSESLKYQIPPHSVKTDTKFCPDCDTIMSEADKPDIMGELIWGAPDKD